MVRIEQTLEEARQMMDSFPYALVYFSDGPWLGETGNLNEEQVQTVFQEESYRKGRVLECRLFGETSELHLYPGEDGVHVLQVTDDGSDSEQKEYCLSARFGKGQTLKVREYFSYDEDGQVFVQRTSLCGIGGVI